MVRTVRRLAREALPDEEVLRAFAAISMGVGMLSSASVRRDLCSCREFSARALNISATRNNAMDVS